MKFACLIIFSFLLYLNSTAQTVAVDGEFKISHGTTLKVEGGLILKPASSIQNNGILQFTEKWENNSDQDALTGTGIVKITGVDSAIIGGIVPTRFHLLDLSEFPDVVKLEQDISISSTGILSLGAGHILLNSNLLMVENSMPSAILPNSGTLISETGPVEGYSTIGRVIGNNSGTYNYYTGNAQGANLPFVLNIDTAGVGSAGAMLYSTYPTVNSNDPLPTGAGSLDGQEMGTVNRYWIVEPQDYTTLPISTLTFSYEDVDWQGQSIISEYDLRLFRWNGTQWAGPLPVNIDSVNNTITLSGTNKYGIFAVADQATPLPVNLLWFTAKRVQQDALLEWETASENENKGFELLVSLDGKQYSHLSWVDADWQGGSFRKSYQFTDRTNDKYGMRYYKRVNVKTWGLSLFKRKAFRV